MEPTVTDFALFGTQSAVLSTCGRYRYRLTRTWGEGRRTTFIMLNPSTADAELDDPTIRRCVRFAADLGTHGLEVVNLYAFRATDPADMLAAPDPVGPENDRYLAYAARLAAAHKGPLIAAWGANARAERVEHVLRLPHMERLTALSVTKSGAPGHPLYLPATSRPTAWP